MARKPRILFLTKYARNGASSRYRILQYLPALEQAGVDCTVKPLFDEQATEQRYHQGGEQVGTLARAFIRRINALMTAPKFDTVVVEKEIIPYFTATPEYWLYRAGIPYFVDYDDALFHQYDQHNNPLVRRFLGSKIARVMHKAHAVIAGNQYLANYAVRAGSRVVEVIPTVVDLRNYTLTGSAHSTRAQLVIGWIGSPSTAKYVPLIGRALREVCSKGGIIVRLIGSGPMEIPGVPIEHLPWDEAREIEEVAQFDVGIMPLPDEDWARGKCGLKLIQYMACGLPVVASPVGVNTTIVTPGVNGLLAKTEDDWVAALNRLLSDRDLCKRLGAAGRRKVEEEYCLTATASRFVSLVTSALPGTVAEARSGSTAADQLR